jgi:hypothetical protein
VRLDFVQSPIDYLFETKIKPHLQPGSQKLESKELTQSNAFRRFLIGQISLFSRYPTPLNLDHIKTYIVHRLRDGTPFNNAEQDQIRKQLEQYILGLEGLRLMSREEALNAIDCNPVFPPVYISYMQMQNRYATIANCVEQCITRYVGPIVKVKGGSMFPCVHEDVTTEFNNIMANKL